MQTTELAFLDQGGEAGALIAARDWSNTPLGPIADWPSSLKTSVALLLRSSVAIVLLWGEEGVMLYNDAYSRFAGGRHPDLLGSNVREGWPEVADFNDHVMRTGLAGKSLTYKDQELTLYRHGQAEAVSMDLSYSPVVDERGVPGGVICILIETTGRVAGERRLAAERQRQRLMLQQMPGFAAMLSGPDHVFDYVNEAYLDIAGDRDFIGRTVRDAFPELADQGFYELLDRVYSTGEPFAARGLPIALDRRDGHRFIDLLYQPVFADSGEVIGIFVGGYDVTARFDTEHLLRASEARYRALFDSIEAGFCVVEVDQGDDDRPIDYRVVEANPAFYRQTGFPEAVLGQWLRKAAPDLEEHWFQTYARVARTATPERFEQGSPALGRWFDVYAFPEGGTGRDRVAILFNDISARRNAEEALRQLNETLEARVIERTAERDRLWDTSPDLMLVMGADGIFHRANPAWTTLLGYAPDELVGRHIADFVMADGDAEADGAAIDAAVALATDRYRHRDGSLRCISWVAAPVGDKTYATGRDVTAERQQADALRDAEEQLRQAQKMEAVGQLTGGLAHDFNNLLTGMMGNLELLQMRLHRNGIDDFDRFIVAAQGAGKRAAALTQRLLAFSRRQTLDPKPTDINRLIAGMQELLQRTVGPVNTIDVVGTAGLWTANIDAGQLENALLNLCINARDAMPDGGRVTIETTNHWLEEDEARLRDLPPGPYLSICVTDTGTGMSAETIERAFEPFYTTKPLGQGTGLGLSMIYGFARQSHGQVRIESSLGSGTTICIYLPRHMGDALLPAEEEAVAAAAAANGQTVLVVDDEATIRHLIDEVLDGIGYTVIGAADGSAGLKVLQSGARIELLITDVGLPNGMNGRQVADAARQFRPGLKILFITGYAENAAVGNGHLEPGMELLTKPFTMEALAAKVADMMRM